MIDVFIENGRNTLHTQFPLRMDDLAEQLASIGVRQSVAQITAKARIHLKLRWKVWKILARRLFHELEQKITLQTWSEPAMQLEEPALMDILNF